MKKANRILALVLCAVLMLSLFAGCNKQGDGSGTDAKDSSSASSTTDNKNPTNGNGGQNSGSNTSASEFVYRPTYTPFPETVNWIQSTVLSKDKLFFVTEEVTGAQRTFYDEEWNQLGQIEIDPSEVEYGGGPDGPIEVYEEFEGAISSSFATATTTDTAEGEDEETGDEDVTPPADDKPTDEQDRKYCEELDLWYTYSSDNEVYTQVVYSMNLDGTNAQKLPDFHPMTIPEGSQGNSYIESMTVDPDGNLWVSESGSTYHYDENQEYIWDGEMSSIRKLTATGAEDFTLDVSKIKAEQEYAYFSSLVFDKDGNLYLRESNSNTLYVFDKTGAQTKKIELGETQINNLFLIDGQLYGLYWSETGGQTLAPFDPQKGSFGEGISVPNNVNQILPGGGDYDFYYNNGSEMCGFNAVTGESTTLLNWIDSDINADQLNQLFVTDAGEIYATSNNYESSSGSGWELAKFTKVPASEVPVKTVLNLACVFLDYNLRSAIINFNKTNDTYRIHVSDYSQFNTEDDWNAGVTKLSTEIISGAVPDIILTNNLPFNTYAKKGLLEDLLPYIQSDAELSGQVMLDAFKPVMTADGKLPLIASSFRFQTVAGAAAVVGDKPGWTMQDLENAMRNMPEGARAFGAEMTRGQLLNYLCQMTQGDYIDYDTGNCNFNSDEFKTFLKFIADYPEEIDWDSFYGEDYNWETDSTEAQVAAGRVMLNVVSFSDFWDFQYQKGIFLNKPFTFVGFPSSSGKGSTVYYNIPLAMSTTCSDKQGAWEFMRTILLPEFESYGFSTNKQKWDENLKQFMEPQYYYDENGDYVEYVPTQNIGGKEIKVDRFSQADVDQILDLLNYCTSQTSIDQKVLEIITEDAQAYFKGQKTLDDVCATIQSRVSLYIKETM